MEELYNDLLERQEHLQSQEYSVEGKYRQRELNLMIVRVQQLLLHNVLEQSEQLLFSSCGDPICKCLKKDDCILIGYKP